MLCALLQFYKICARHCNAVAPRRVVALIFITAKAEKTVHRQREHTVCKPADAPSRLLQRCCAPPISMAYQNNVTATSSSAAQTAVHSAHKRE